MCGIVGVKVQGRRDDALRAVGRGMSALAHRGPDDEGMVECVGAPVDASVVFGHRRLSIIDLSAGGHQPMHDPLTGNWITYNGEIFNYRELRRELESQGCSWKSNSDTEVILASYRVWGRDCVTRWRGMFAAAIWDESRQEIFLVRDRLGIKPLYYAQIRESAIRNPQSEIGFVFASEVRALLATGLIEPKLNVAAIDTFLMFGAVQDPLTMIEGVHSLPAGHTLTVERNGDLRLDEYWEVPLRTGNETNGSGSGKAQIKETLAEAVRLRLISDVPLGVFLSGGIDSSAVAMLAKAGSPDAVKTFTIGFEDKSFDEGVQAKETAAALGVEHHSILLTEDEMLASHEQAIAALDQPSIDGVNTYHISRAVKQAGMTVALSGLGGDEVFCGYEHFRTIPRREKLMANWSHLPFAVRRLAASAVPGADSDRKAKTRALLLAEYGFSHPYFLSRTLFLPDQIAGLLTPEALPQIDYGGWGSRMQAIQARAQTLDPVNRLSYFELKTYLANTLLRDTDVMSMAHSLEVRVPLLDHLLVEQVMHLPGGSKLEGNGAKPLLVSSLPQALPHQVASGPKRGFVLPYAKWLKGALRPELEQAFAQPPSALEGVLSSEAMKQVWESFLAGRTSWTRPWSLFVLGKVAARLAESQPVRDVEMHAYHAPMLT